MVLPSNLSGESQTSVNAHNLLQLRITANCLLELRKSSVSRCVREYVGFGEKKELLLFEIFCQVFRQLHNINESVAALLDSMYLCTSFAAEEKRKCCENLHLSSFFVVVVL